MSKNFTELTREELIDGIIGFIIPKIVSEKKTLETFNMDKEDGKGYAIKKREDKYFKGNMTWDYYNEEIEDFDLDWKEISEEEMIECIKSETNELTLNQLRAQYKNNEWTKEKLSEKQRLETKLELVKMLLCD